MNKSIKIILIIIIIVALVIFTVFGTIILRIVNFYKNKTEQIDENRENIKRVIKEIDDLNLDYNVIDENAIKD